MERYQRELEGWKSKFTAPHERTPQGELGRQMQEGVELYLAVANYDGTPKRKQEVVEEGIDCIIGLLGVINAADPTVNVDTVMQKKLTVINNKYQPEKVNMFKKQGLTTEQAMERCKALYVN